MKKGSSLILVLLVIAGVITVTVGAQRIVLVQFAQSGQATDNTFAYNAAKAGIEDGLTRFRYNRNVETALNKVYRYDLSSGTAADPTTGEIATDTKLTAGATDEVYDLSIDFKAQQIAMSSTGAAVFTDANKIAQDGFVELTGFATSTSPYYLRYAFNFVTSTGAKCTDPRAFAQLQITYFNAASGKATVAEASTPPGQFTYDSRSNISNLLVNPDTRTIKTLRIRPYYCSAQFALASSISTTGDGKGIGADKGPEFDSLTTSITSTGYYGSAKRTLLATVNRTTGQLIGIYDFAAYAGTGSVSK